MSAEDLQTQTPAELPPELAELASLAAAADARNAGQDAPPLAAGQDAPSPADQGAELAAMLKAVVLMAGPVAPYVPKAYDDATCDRIGLALAAVAEKYGWDMGKLASPEVMLAFVTIPPTISAVAMAKEYYAWKARQAAEAARQAQHQAQAQTVTDGG